MYGRPLEISLNRKLDHGIMREKIIWKLQKVQVGHHKWFDTHSLYKQIHQLFDTKNTKEANLDKGLWKNNESKKEEKHLNLN